MRRISTLHIIGVFILIGWSTSTLAAPGRRHSGGPALPSGISGSWYNDAVANIQKREYFIRTFDQPGVYTAVNHPQYVSYLFTGRGYGVTNFDENGATDKIWHSQLWLTGIGRGGRWHASPLVSTAKTSDESVQFDYGNYVLSYANRKLGMEQSFLIRDRPSGKAPLQIVLQLTGDLAARPGEKDQVLLYTPGHPASVALKYDQLSVWDKDGQRLPAHLSLGARRRLVITVDDRNAVYPVTVDPTTHSPSLSLNVNNLLNSGLNDAATPVLFGYSVAGAGNVGGDANDDIIIGAPTFTTVSSITATTLTLSAAVVGAAFVYYGVRGALPSTTPSNVIQPSGLVANALFGFSVAGTGVIAGGSTGAVVIGAPGEQVVLLLGAFPTVARIGAAYVFNSNTLTGGLSSLPSPTATLTLQGSDFPGTFTAPTINPLFGWSVSSAGDVNGDGYADILIGAPYYSSTSFSQAGRVNIYEGGSSGLGTSPATQLGGQTASELFGFSVASAGNVNGATNGANPIDAIIIGAPGALVAGFQLIGHAYVFNGSSSGIASQTASTASQTLAANSGSPASLFGFSVGTAGDFNHDGFSDVIVGEPLALDHLGAAGKATIYYGSASGIGIATSTVLQSPRSPTATGGTTGINLLFGYSVSTTLNTVGDVADDVIVGEPGSTAINNISTLLGLISGTPTYTGQAYIFGGMINTGANAGSFTPALTITDPNSDPSLLGSSVASLGDVDGDGLPDVMVGSSNGILDLGYGLNTSGVQITLGASGHGLIPFTAAGSTGIGNAYLFLGSAILSDLPVTLFNFTGQAEQSSVLLNWATAQEQNSSYFGVERSPDGLNYTAIGQVAAAGNSSQVINYSFTDGAPLAGVNYYRLKMVNLDGSFVYSPVVVVNFNSSAPRSVSVYPNPAHGSFNLSFTNVIPGRYAMSLLNAAGETVMATEWQVGAVSNTQVINLPPNIASGTYLIRIVDPQLHVIVDRIIIQ